MKFFLLPLMLAVFVLPPLGAQAPHVHPANSIPPVPLQPLAQQVRRLEDALNFLGQPLPAKTRAAINDAIAMPDESAAVRQIEAALDPFVLAIVDINGESRVKVERGAAQAALVQGGSRFFLVKVINGGECDIGAERRQSE